MPSWGAVGQLVAGAGCLLDGSHHAVFQTFVVTVAYRCSDDIVLLVARCDEGGLG